MQDCLKTAAQEGSLHNGANGHSLAWNNAIHQVKKLCGCCVDESHRFLSFPNWVRDAFAGKPADRAVRLLPSIQLVPFI